MLLHRSPEGVIWRDEHSVVLRVRPALHRSRRASVAELRAGALDGAIAAAFGSDAVAEVHGRDRTPSDPPCTDQEIDQIVAGLRAGVAEIVVGGSRTHTTYRARDGEVVSEDFDEGVTGDEQVVPAHALRYLAQGEPFLELLRIPWRRALAAALLAQGRPRDAFGELLAYGECLFEGDLLEAVFAAPEETLPIREGVTGDAAYAAIMSALGGAQSPEAGRAGLAFFSTLASLAGSREIPSFEARRAELAAMAPAPNEELPVAIAHGR